MRASPLVAGHRCHALQAFALALVLLCLQRSPDHFAYISTECSVDPASHWKAPQFKQYINSA